MSELDDTVEDMKYYFNAVRDSVNSHGMAGCVLLGLVTERTGNTVGHFVFPVKWTADMKLEALEKFVAILKNELEKEKGKQNSS